MKFTINYLDHVAVELTLARDASGQWLVEGVFPVFPGRPGHPHLSLFTRPNGRLFTWHCTAWGGRDRSWLPKFSAGAARRWSEAAARTAYASHVRALELVDLQQLDETGWRVHWVHWPVVTRWLRLLLRGNRTLSLTAERIDSLCMHALRHWAPPRDLIPIADHRCFAMVRWNDESDEPDVRMLMHYPNGVPLPNADGTVAIVRPPGWYVDRLAGNTPNVDKFMASGRMGRALQMVQRFLGRHPRRGPEPERPELGRLASFVAGYCGSDLTQLALATAIEDYELCLSRTGHAEPAG